ncbi:MAG: hypothetical protein RR420_00745 [Anaerovoracaceae bacterium]
MGHVFPAVQKVKISRNLTPKKSTHKVEIFTNVEDYKKSTAEDTDKKSELFFRGFCDPNIPLIVKSSKDSIPDIIKVDTSTGKIVDPETPIIKQDKITPIKKMAAIHNMLGFYSRNIESVEIVYGEGDIIRDDVNYRNKMRSVIIPHSQIIEEALLLMELYDEEGYRIRKNPSTSKYHDAIYSIRPR